VARGADGGGTDSVQVADVGRLDTPLDRVTAGRLRLDKLLDTFAERQGLIGELTGEDVDIEVPGCGASSA
jgi:hypothetical protein